MSLRILLLPFASLYGLALRVRNLLFDFGIIKSKLFPFPVIVVGNLTTGGTGKTPHVLYIVNLLKEKFKVVTLSRGYGRTTSGFLIADEKSNASLIGDEPMLYHHRYNKSVVVAVGEKRVEAIAKIKNLFPQTETLILDDAFQHRYVKGGLTILLTDFRNPFFNDYLLPAGNLREPIIGMIRADLIIVTKCPDDLSEAVQRIYARKINLQPHQQLFFSGLKYGNLFSLKDESTESIALLNGYEVLLVTGIANPKPLKKYLEGVCRNVLLLRFADHHQFTNADIRFIERNFNTIASTKKIIITTEKDAMRLQDLTLSTSINQLPVFYLTVEIEFINKQSEFDQHIINYVTKN